MQLFHPVEILLENLPRLLANDFALETLDDLGFLCIFYKVNKPTKNVKEAEIVQSFQSKVVGQQPWQILQKNFDRMK